MNKKVYISPAIEVEVVVNDEMICTSVTGGIKDGTTESAYSKQGGSFFDIDFENDYDE